MFIFAVPFDEDVRDREVWFLDHDYLEQMYSMFKKVNGKLALMDKHRRAKPHKGVL